MTERILIVDDHPLTRDALSALLGGNGFDVVGVASGGAEAVAQAALLQPDVVLLDITMPEIDGLAALPQIREAAPGAEVVMLTASEDEENLLAAIRGGACGYLLKSEPPERIVAFLRGVASGEAALSGSVARRLLAEVRDGGRRDVVPDSISRVLSARELEVLLLLDHHLGTEEIAQRLFISEHTVRSHVKNMLAQARRLLAARGARPAGPGARVARDERRALSNLVRSLRALRARPRPGRAASRRL